MVTCTGWPLTWTTWKNQWI